MSGLDSHIDSVYYDKPLPDRTKIDIWECYARHVLQFIDSNKYGNLTYSDKPDLIDRTRSLGIEVTDSQSRESREAESLYSRLAFIDDQSWRKRQIERIEQCGAHYESGILFGPRGADSFELVYEALNKKLERLNSNDYELFRRNKLFVKSTILADEKMLREALSKMEKQSRDHPRRFASVTVSVPGHNYVFDFDSSTYKSLEFGSSEQFRIADSARWEVIRAELS